MAEQLRLPLASKTAMGREDFFVSEANQLAVTALEDWTGWPLGKVVLIGPEGAGKTHLAHVWAAETGARITPASGLVEAELPALADGPVVLEDLHEVGQETGQDAERLMFHLHNLMQSSGQPLLMTSRLAPAHLEVRLKDLASRLEGTTTIALEPPDDLLLQVVMMKLFADRQINPPARFVDYVMARLPRSFAAARAFVDEIDARALSENRPIGQKLAGEILAHDLDNKGKNPA